MSTTTMTHAKIRAAKPSDMREVLKMIEELAIYEKEPDAVKITENDLVKDGFEDQLFRCILAEIDDEIAGMALFYPRYSTWNGRTLHLEDFIVKEKFRKRGIGDLLFKSVVAEAKKFGAQRMEWVVLEWNKPAISFYKKKKATLDAEWHLGQLTPNQMDEILNS